MSLIIKIASEKCKKETKSVAYISMVNSGLNVLSLSLYLHPMRPKSGHHFIWIHLVFVYEM